MRNMGCWNETDALTRLAIREDEEIVLVVLESEMPRFFKAERFLSDTLYSPFGLPFYGTYDGYGSILLDPEKAEYHTRFMDVLKKHAHLMDHSGNPSLTSTPEPIASSPEEFLAKIAREDIKGPHGGVFTVVFFKHDIWTSLLEQMSRSTSYFYEYGKVTYRENAERTLDSYDSVSAPQDDEAYRTIHVENERNEILRRLGFRSPGAIRDYLDSETVSDEVRENIIRMALTNSLLERLRIGWTPQVGSGSQDEELELTKTLHTLALKQIAEREAEYDNE